jgi:hypothetical protein
VFAFERSFLAPLLGAMTRRASMSVSVNEHHLYVEMGAALADMALQPQTVF